LQREPGGADPGYSIINPKRERSMETVHLNIEGMTCEHCVRAVDGRLRKTPGVQVEKVVVGAVDLHYDKSRISLDDISELIADEGYTVA
jgi:copper chaperone